jgi:RNase H-like domain found in reverse transcriptase
MALPFIAARGRKRKCAKCTAIGFLYCTRLMRRVAYPKSMAFYRSASGIFLRTSAPWLWTDEYQQAFERLKWAITIAPLLDITNPAEKFRVECDASKVGVGAILKQNGKPCAYLARKFSSSERNYHITEQKLAAVCMTLTEWRRHS